MNREEIFDMGVRALRAKLTELGLDSDGTKEDLQKRLLEVYKLESTDNDETTDNSGGGMGKCTSAGGSPGRGNCEELGDIALSKSMYTLRDVEDSLSQFSGTSSPDVIQWLDEFEKMGQILKWSQLQFYVYGKQLLIGAAKMFVRSQRHISDWHSLKTALKNEFGMQFSTAEVIRRIQNQRLNRNETLIEFLYSIMEVGAQINLDEKSVIEYFIEGIPDSRANKAVLYQADSIRELKKMIMVYEKTRSSPQSLYKGKNPVSAPKRASVPKIETSGSDARCYKCGGKFHIAKNCPEKQPKCFLCQKFGHRSFECPNAKTEKRAKAEGGQVNMVRKGPGLIFKDIIMRGKTLTALVDTGCDVCIIRFDMLFILGEVNFVPDRVTLFGIGDGAIVTMGRFNEVVHIDDLNIEVTFYVVGERDVNHSILLGNSLINKAEVIIKKGEAMFKMPSKESNVLEAFPGDCLNIDQYEPDIPVDLEHLHGSIKNQVVKAVTEYQPKRNTESPVKMKIILTDDIPIFHRPRRLPIADQAIVEDQIAVWLKEGIVQPSSSEYASPIVLVSKKDGTKRLCCDFRKLNQKIVRDHFPMPLIDEVLDKLQSAALYTTLDLRNGFFHVPLEESSRKYTAFVTHNGQFEFLFAPFGLSNSPAVFTRFISAVFRDLIREGVVIVYMDDIIVPAKDMIDGLEKFVKVLKTAAANGLRIKWEKCEILCKTVNFLGYVVEQGSIKPSKEKIKAVDSFPIPTDRKALQRFLGLTSYFRKFIDNYAIVAKPLTDMLRKNTQFLITDEVLLACQQLKEALISAPVLKLYDPNAITEVHTDASKYGYGAVLLQRSLDEQDLRPVQYMSRRTKPYEENYHSYELEVLAVVEALKKWRVYLISIPFTIVTDCNAFRLTMNKDDVPARISRWAMFLQEFSYQIEHRSGTRMRHVDALSRMACLIAESSLTHRIRCAQETDECTRAIRAVLEYGQYEDYYMQNGVLYKDPNKELIVIPVQLEQEIIKLAQNQGHFSISKTCELVEKQYYIPRLTTKVPNIVRSCVECIITDAKSGRKEGYLNPIDKEDRPLATYHIDHVGPMEVTKKAYNHLFVVVDGFTKFVWLYPTKSTDSKSVIECLERQSAIFGNPHRIISDRGTAFTSQAFKDYCVEENIQHLMITTGVPRGNGQVERIHKIVVPMLAKLCAETPQNWYKHVRRVQMLINSTAPRSTRVTPFRLLTGVDMRLPDYPVLQEMLKEEAINAFDEQRNDIRSEARENIEKIQRENCKTYNLRRKPEVEYAVNDLVAIKRTQFGSGLKLRGKYLGPYKVVGKLPRGRYQVEKVGYHEGPNRTCTVAEFMKPWQSGPYCRQEGRM